MYGNRRYTAVFIRPHHWHQYSSIHPDAPLHSPHILSIIFCQLLLNPQRGLVPSGFQTIIFFNLTFLPSGLHSSPIATSFTLSPNLHLYMSYDQELPALSSLIWHLTTHCNWTFLSAYKHTFSSGPVSVSVHTKKHRVQCTSSSC